MARFFLPIVLLISLLLLVKIAISLSVTCRIGGPYMKNSTYNATVNIVGDVTDVAATDANVSVNLTRNGVVLATRDIKAGTDGRYMVSINTTLEVGTYVVNVSAEKSSVYAYCNNTTQASLPQPAACLERSLQVAGVAVYPDTGLAVEAGAVRLSVQEETYASQTSFTDGQFSSTLTACLTPGKRYILQVYIEDVAGKKNWSYMFINW